MVTGNFREQLKFMNAISTNQIAGLLKGEVHPEIKLVLIGVEK